MSISKLLFSIFLCANLTTTVSQAEVSSPKGAAPKVNASVSQLSKSNDFLQMLIKKSHSPQNSKSSKGQKNMAPNGACTLGGGGCNFDSDCCSSNCYSGVCQGGFGGCTSGAGNCTFDSDCCSGNCTNSVCGHDGGGCTSMGACTFDSDCCSGNCHNGQCGTSCYPDGYSCTYDMECCTGNCHAGRCGGGGGC